MTHAAALFANWNIRALVFCHAAAALLMLSWVWPPLREIWDYVDEFAYFYLNGIACHGATWIRRVAAYANTKTYDKISTLVLAGMLGLYALLGRGENLPRRLSTATFTALFMLIVVNLRRDTNFMELGRLSPSQVFPDRFCDLTAFWTDTKVKIASSSSFPGDHFISCIFFVTLFWAAAGWRWGLASLALTPAFVLPRLISGAHWVTDGLVGAAVFCLVTLSWTMATPFYGAGRRVLASGWERALPRALKVRLP